MIRVADARRGRARPVPAGHVGPRAGRVDILSGLFYGILDQTGHRRAATLVVADARIEASCGRVGKAGLVLPAEALRLRHGRRRVAEPHKSQEGKQRDRRRQRNGDTQCAQVDRSIEIIVIGHCQEDHRGQGKHRDGYLPHQSIPPEAIRRVSYGGRVGGVRGNTGRVR